MEKMSIQNVTRTVSTQYNTLPETFHKMENRHGLGRLVVGNLKIKNFFYAWDFCFSDLSLNETKETCSLRD